MTLRNVSGYAFVDGDVHVDVLGVGVDDADALVIAVTQRPAQLVFAACELLRRRAVLGAA